MKKKIKLLIIAAAELPIPAIKGGATETLIGELLKRESIRFSDDLDITVASHCKGNDKKDGIVKYTFFPKTCYEKIHFIFYLTLRILSGKKRNIPDIFPIQIAKKNDLSQYDMIILEGNKDQVLPLRDIYKGIIVLHIHTVMTLTKETYMAGKVVEQCNGIVANSVFALNKMLQITSCVQEKCVVLKNCIAIEQYKKDQSETQKHIRDFYNIKNEEFVVIYAGRLEPGKGVLELIRSFKKIALTEDIKIKLLIVGASWFSCSKKTRYIKELERESYSIQDKVIFTGYVPHEKMASMYQAANIAIMPSLYEESAGLVALEAQASGLPVIVSNVGGLPEYVHEKSRLKVKTDKELEDTIADLIIKLYRDKEFYNTEMLLSLENVQNYGMDRYAKEFQELVKEWGMEL